MNNIILTVEEIININEAVTSIAEKETLSATTAYRLGRLKKYAEGVMKEFNKAKNKKIEDYNKAIARIGITEDQKLDLRNRLQHEVDELLEVAEQITVPELKLSDFTDDNGKLLVPQKFLSLMGQVIEDDKQTGDYSSLIKNMVGMFNGHNQDIK
jgi:hypothetical protein